jgi:hypothetical protein
MAVLDVRTPRRADDRNGELHFAIESHSYQCNLSGAALFQGYHLCTFAVYEDVPSHVCARVER